MPPRRMRMIVITCAFETGHLVFSFSKHLEACPVGTPTETWMPPNDRSLPPRRKRTNNHPPALLNRMRCSSLPPPPVGQWSCSPLKLWMFRHWWHYKIPLNDNWRCQALTNAIFQPQGGVSPPPSFSLIKRWHRFRRPHRSDILHTSCRVFTYAST